MAKKTVKKAKVVPMERIFSRIPVAQANKMRAQMKRFKILTRSEYVAQAVKFFIENA